MEEKELILLAKQGDKSAKEKLYLRNKNMILKAYQTAYKINKEIDKDDVIQDLNMVFLCALENYKYNENVKFSTYLYKCLFSKVYRIINNNQINRIKFRRKEESLYYKIIKLYKSGLSKEEIIEELNISEEEYSLIYGILSGKTFIDDENVSMELEVGKDISEEVINKIYTEQLLSLLNEKERTVIYNRFYLMKTQSQIATQLNSNQVYVQRLEKKALKKMKNHIDNTMII